MGIIAITGGIGCGKSVVSHILSILGHPVYDTDSMAKQLMNKSLSLKKNIQQLFGDDLYINDELNRKKLAYIVFNHPQKLKQLNALVHPAICSDVKEWSKNYKVAFVETAIPYTSGISNIVDAFWTVVAPESIRISRVINRSALSVEEIKNRMNAQANELQQNAKDYIITNDGQMPIIPQVITGLNGLK